MVRLFKFVALALMLIMGVVPMLGAPAGLRCITKSGAVVEPMSHCAMMAMMAMDAERSLAVQATDEMPPCCRVVPAKPVRTVELQMPVASAELALLPANETVGAAPTTTQARADYHIPLPDSARSQSHLCTFLI